MAAPIRLSTKYECCNENSSNASYQNEETDSSKFLSKQSDEFKMLFLLMQNSYRGGEWLPSLKLMSVLVDHVNKSLLQNGNFESSHNQFDSGDDHPCDRNAFSNDPVSYTDDARVNDYVQSSIKFKADLSVLVNEVIFHIRTNECLKEYSFSVIEEILNPIKTVYCKHMDIMLSLSHLLFSLDIKDEALQLAHEVTQTFPKSAVALETFENICCHVVDRWHFRMLNDITRNKAFENAIEYVLLSNDQGKTVCDIGSGTGLLSFISAKYANSVYAVESSSLMCHIAKLVMEMKTSDVDPAGKIQLVNEMSTNLQVSKNFPERVNVLVTETFDAGLFGEGIVTTLSHAWRDLLVKEEMKDQDAESKASRVVPQKAKMFVEAISSHDIYQESSFHHDGMWHDINLANISVVSMTSMVQSDPYSSCHLKDLTHGYNPLSDVHPLMEVNFNNPEEIFDLEKGVSGTFDLSITEGGSLDALVVWFKLSLTDSVSLSTHPMSGSCWEQAVFPVRNLALNESKQSKEGGKLNAPTLVGKGDKVITSYHLEENRLSLHGVDLTRKGEPPAEQELKVHVPSSPCQPKLLADPSEWWSQNVFCLREWEILQLNMGAYHNKLVQHTLQWMDLHKTSITCVIDLHSGFSPLSLQLSHQGCTQVFMLEQHQTQKALACKLAYINKLDMRKINFFQDPSELMEFEFLTSALSAQKCSPSSRAALALCEVVDFQGRLVENLACNFEYLRHVISNFSSSHILPQKVDIHGMFVESNRLRNDSCVVSDEKTLGFPIGRFLNEYSVTNHPGISLSTLPHKKLTEPFKIFSLDLESVLNDSHYNNESKEAQDKPQVDNHDAEAKPCRTSDYPAEQQRCENVHETHFPVKAARDERSMEGTSCSIVSQEDKESQECSYFDQCVDLKVPAMNNGNLSALVYWFDIQLSPSQHLVTTDPSLHWKQAAVMLKNEMNISKGEEISFNIRLKNSTLIVKVKS